MHPTLPSTSLRAATALALLALVAACPSRPAAPPAAPATRPLSVAGLEVHVPTAFVALDAARLERLRRTAAQQEPDGEHTVAGARAESLTLGMVYVQRSVIRRPLPAEATTVRQALALWVDALSQHLAAAGATVHDRTVGDRDGGLEVCLRAVLTDPDGHVAAPRLCALFTVGPGERLHSLTTSCFAPAESKLCDVVLQSRRYTSSDALPYDRRLAARPGQGLDGGSPPRSPR